MIDVVDILDEYCGPKSYDTRYFDPKQFEPDMPLPDQRKTRLT